MTPRRPGHDPSGARRSGPSGGATDACVAAAACAGWWLRGYASPPRRFPSGVGPRDGDAARPGNHDAHSNAVVAAPAGGRRRDGAGSRGRHARDLSRLTGGPLDLVSGSPSDRPASATGSPAGPVSPERRRARS